MRHLGLYRPHGKDITKGIAIQFKPGGKIKDKSIPALYIEAVQQSSPKPPIGSSASCFDWSQKINIMLGLDEMASIVAAIDGLSKDPIEITHSFKRGDDEQNTVSGFLLKKGPQSDWVVGVKEGQTRIQGYMTVGQLVQLRTICQLCLNKNFLEDR